MTALLDLASHATAFHAPVPHLALLGLNLEQILQDAGPWVLGIVAVIVFIESGVLFPFLPGDSLLFTTGMLHTQLHLNLVVLLVVIFLSAFLGDQTGYALGKYFGRRLFSPRGRVLNYENLDKASDFFDRYGGKAMILARFVPIVRTFTPLAAGMAGYRYRTFLKWEITGAACWTLLLTLAGVLLGNVAFIRDHIDLIVVLLVLLSLVPIVFEVLKERKKAQRLAEGLVEDLSEDQ